jgi:hypothetical protein
MAMVNRKFTRGLRSLTNGASIMLVLPKVLELAVIHAEVKKS